MTTNMTTKRSHVMDEIDIEHDAIDEYFECITACSLIDEGIHCLTQCIDIHHHHAAQNRLRKEKE